MQPSANPVPEHLRPLPSGQAAHAWVWQVPLSVVLTLGALYQVAGLVDHCADRGAFCPDLTPIKDAQVAPRSEDPATSSAPARPVMTFAYAALPLGMADAPPAQEYSLPTGMTVEDAATQPAAIALGEVNLIAVVEADGLRHALVRLPGGRILRLREGDRLQDATVAAIGAQTLYMLGTDSRPRALVLGG